MNYILMRKMEQYFKKLGDIIQAPQDSMNNYPIAFMSGALIETLAHYIKSKKNTPKEIVLIIKVILSG